MKKNLTEIVFILDRSGSMMGIRQDAIGGFNSFIEEQKKAEGEARVTTVLFNQHVEFLAENVDISEIKELNEETFVPSGMTALLDAIGVAIDKVGDRLAKTPEEERPEKIVFAIMTDGYENMSKEYNRNQVFEKINHQTEKYNWQFLYLGANQDSIGEATKLGIKGQFAGNFVADSYGTTTAYLHANEMVKSYREVGEMKSFIDASLDVEKGDK